MLSYLLKKIPYPNIFGNERGIALFIVLWVLVLLSVIAGEFSHAMRTAVNITRNFREETEAYYIARAGVSVAIAKLVRQETRPRRRVSVETTDAAQQDGDWRVNTDIPPVPFGRGSFQVRIENESGKVDINSADAPLLRVMLNPFDLSDTEKDVIVDSIIDWRDPDSFHHVNGAEDDYYLALAEPYEARDGPFLSKGELLLVRGITPDIFYGGLENMVTVRSGGVRGGNRVFGGGNRKQYQGRININAAASQLLDAFPGIDQEEISAVKAFRTDQDFQSPNDLQDVLGSEAYSVLVPFITFDNSSFFSISVSGNVGECPVSSKVDILVDVDAGIERGYRIVQWFEG